MRLKKYSICTLLIVLAGSIFAQNNTNTQLLTFEDAMRMMEEQNPALNQGKQHIRQREYEQKEKYGLYLPQISVSAKAVSMSEMLHLDLKPVSEAIVPLYTTLGTYGQFSGVPNPDPSTNTFAPVLPDDVSTAVVREQLLEAGNEISNSEWDQVIQEKNFATVTADFVWPILAGGKIRGANKAAEVQLRMSQEELRQTEGLLSSELVTRYYGLALGYQVVKVREQMFTEMEKHYSDAQKMFDNGMIAKVELLHAAVSKNEAERNLKQAKRNIKIIRSGLAATLMLDSGVVVLPTNDLFINKKLEDISYWLAKAEGENPQLHQLEGKKELIDIKNTVNKNSYLPSVAVVGTYNLAEENLSPYLPKWMVGVGASWTLTDGMARQRKIKASSAMQEQVVFAEQKAHADLSAYITKLYQELQMLMEQKTELESTLELAQEYSNSTVKAFNEGFATSSSVVEAYNKVAQVKALRLKVFYDYDVALAQLLQYAGTPEAFLTYCNGENTITESIK